MKKRITLIILAMLLIGTLTACTEDTTVADYQILEVEMYALEEERELTLTAEIMFDLLAVEGAAVYVDTTQIRADGMDEAMEIHRSRDRNGAPVSEIGMILTDGTAYMDIGSAMYFVMAELIGELEVFGISMEDVPFDAISGSYTHLQYTDEMMADMRAEMERAWSGLYGAFAEEALEEYLSYNDGIFRIEIAGESVDAYVEAALEEMNLDDVSMMLVSVAMVANIDDGLWAELEDDFADWLRAGDLTDARLVVVRSKMDDTTYHQNIELYIPGRAHITLDATVAVGESAPISAPDQFLTSDELGERVELWVTELILELMSPADSPGATAGGARLEPYTLVGESGKEHTVPAIRGAEAFSFGSDHVAMDAGAIELYYGLVSGYDIFEVMEVLAAENRPIMDDEDVIVGQVFPEIRSVDGSAIVSGFSMDMFGEVLVLLNLVQDIPDSDYVLSMVMLLYEGFWTLEDSIILDELGDHFGVDISVILPW